MSDAPPCRRRRAVALGILAASAGPALAHATLLGSTPSARALRVDEETKQVVLRFSEPVQIVNRSDVSVVGARLPHRQGARVHAPDGRAQGRHPAAHADAGGQLHGACTGRLGRLALRVAGLVFAVAGAPLSAPILAGSGGLTDTSPAVGRRARRRARRPRAAARPARFRALVWGPAVARPAARSSEADASARSRHGQRLFWRAFWGLAVLAGVAETVVLAAKSAVVFHTGLVASLLQPAAAYHLVVGVALRRSAGLAQRRAVPARRRGLRDLEQRERGPPSAGRRGPAALMALLGVTALTLLASQGHASQAPLAPLSIAADAVHLGGAALWVGGLPCLIAVLLRAPRVLPEAGARWRRRRSRASARSPCCRWPSSRSRASRGWPASCPRPPSCGPPPTAVT